jgi:hypothetical protein
MLYLKHAKYSKVRKRDYENFFDSVFFFTFFSFLYHLTVKVFAKNLTALEPRYLKLEAEILSQKIALRSECTKNNTS